MSSSVYFDLKVSNSLYCSVSIRKVAIHTWAYEIVLPYAGNRGQQTYMDTVTWNVDDEHDSVDYLYLAQLVLQDHYPKPVEDL